jgi:hypothetical protein
MQRHLEKSTYWKDKIGHSCNLVEKKTKIHPNLKINHIGIVTHRNDFNIHSHRQHLVAHSRTRNDCKQQDFH